MEKYDRALQLEILKSLIAASPMPLSEQDEKGLISKFNDYNHFVANVLYLKMHRLITDPFIRSTQMNGVVTFLFNNHACEITEKGIDFLLDDGGLSAILNVQTIKIHSDTIVALEDIIAVSNIPPEQQKGLISKLRELPADAIKHLTLQLLTQGALNAPHAIQLIQKLLQ